MTLESRLREIEHNWVSRYHTPTGVSLDIQKLIKALELAIHVLQVTKTQPDEPVNAENCDNVLRDIDKILSGASE